MMNALKQSINNLIFSTRVERLEKEIGELKAALKETNKEIAELNKRLDDLTKSSHKTRLAIGAGYLPPIH